MRIYQTVFVALAVLLISTWALHAQTPEQVFEEANNNYYAGHYQQAIEQYQSLLPHKQSANLQFNLGNAYYQSGDYGPAILHLEKARALNPNNPDILANLQLAQKAAQVPESHGSWLDALALSQNVNTWAWLGVIAFWLTIGFIFIPRLYRWKSPLRSFLVLFFGLCTIISGVSLYGYHKMSKEGIALHKETVLKLAPSSASPTEGFIPAGSMAVVQREHGNFFQITTANNEQGWVSKNDFQKIW